ncbi:MAG: peptidase A8 [Ottowia sp.]|nr:peptidase A8 [Ottowia sp.]
MTRLSRSLACTLAALLAAGAASAQEASCQPLYLVVAMGDMHSARPMAQALQRAKVQATFFAGNSPTAEGDSALSSQWGAWWRELAGAGHAMAVQPWDLPLLRGELPPKRGGGFRVKVQAGVLAGRDYTWDAKQYCRALKESDRWMNFYSGRAALPLFHAPGGVTTDRLEKAARSCGYVHVPWPENFLSSESAQSGAIVLSHLGAQPGQSDEDAAAALEQLLGGLKERGFCFKTLDQHPDYQPWVKQRGAAKPKAEEAQQ